MPCLCRRPSRVRPREAAPSTSRWTAATATSMSHIADEPPSPAEEPRRAVPKVAPPVIEVCEHALQNANENGRAVARSPPAMPCSTHRARHAVRILLGLSSGRHPPQTHTPPASPTSLCYTPPKHVGSGHAPGLPGGSSPGCTTPVLATVLFSPTPSPPPSHVPPRSARPRHSHPARVLTKLLLCQLPSFQGCEGINVRQLHEGAARHAPLDKTDLIRHHIY